MEPSGRNRWQPVAKGGAEDRQIRPKLLSGAWHGVGVLGPEALPATPFLAKLADLGSPHGVLELTP